MTKPRDFCFFPRLCRFLKISWDGRPKCGLDIKAKKENRRKIDHLISESKDKEYFT